MAEFIKENGAAAALQLGHAGRKASRDYPWFGYGPLATSDRPGREREWQSVGPTDAPVGEGWPVPTRLTVADIELVVEAYAKAAKRADDAGFDAIGIHAAHGYLIHSFLSPLANTREDAYGGDMDGRMRLALEVASAVRSQWPGHKPLFYRLSTVDGEPGGCCRQYYSLESAARKRGGCNRLFFWRYFGSCNGQHDATLYDGQSDCVRGAGATGDQTDRVIDHGGWANHGPAPGRDDFTQRES